MTSSRTGPCGYFSSRRGRKLGEAPGDPVPAGLPLRHHLGQPPRAESVPDDDHEVEPRGQFLPQLAKRFAHDAFGSIALDGVTHATRRRNSQAPTLPCRRTPEQKDETGGNHPVAGLLNASKLGTLPNPVASRKPTRWPCQRHGTERHELLLVVGGHCEPPAAATATVREHGAPAPGLQPLAKPVGAAAANVVRLVRAFHGSLADGNRSHLQSIKLDS